MFGVLFLSGLFFERAWCGWVCPAGGVAEVARTVNPKPANAKRLRIVRYSIFAVWFGVLVTGFVLAGGIKGVDPLRLTERYISVDEPVKYIITTCAGAFSGPPRLGRRGAGHGVAEEPVFKRGCGRTALHQPQMRIHANRALHRLQKVHQSCQIASDETPGLEGHVKTTT